MKNLLPYFLSLCLIFELSQQSWSQCLVPASIVTTANPGEIEIEFDFTAVPNPTDFICDVYCYNTTDGQYAYYNGISLTNNPVLLSLPTNGSYNIVATSWDTLSGCSDTTFINSFPITGLPVDCLSYFNAVHINAEELIFTAGNGYSGISSTPTFTWDFGDGSSATGNPINHVFPAGVSANYIVTLTVNDSQCNGTYMMPIAINDPCEIQVTITPTANPGEILIEYNFSGVPNPLDYDCNIYINDNITGINVAYLNINASINPYLFTFSANGDYMIKSYTQDIVNNCYDSLNVGLINITNVSNDCIVNFTSNTSNFTDYIFDASVGFGGISGAQTYFWDFGDGSTGTGNPISHTYTSGTFTNYNVTLTVNDVNCTGVITNNVSAGISNSCSSIIYVTADSLNSPGMTFYASGSYSGSESFFWDFGDGTTSISNPVYHSYFGIGGTNTYNVTLIVIDSIAGCADSVNTIVYSGPNAQCEAVFTIVEDTLNPGNYVGYNLSNSVGTTYYWWDFGDGGTSTDPYPSHTYTAVGLFDVCLTIWSDSNCVDTLCLPLNVTLKSTTTLNILNPNAELSLTENNPEPIVYVYPNPSDGNFTISTLNGKDETGNIQISDITGKIIYNNIIQLGENKIQISLNQTEPGIYFVILNGKTLTKIVIE